MENHQGDPAIYPNRIRISQDESYLMQYMKYVEGDQRYECITCCKRFESKGSIRRHIRVHTGEKPFQCNFCDKRCGSRSNLISHMKRRHNHSYDTIRRCDDKQESELNQDSFTLYGRYLQNDKRYECVVCSKKFKRKNDAVRHIKIHTGERPYKCDFCEKRFIVRGAVMKHMRLMHGSSFARLYMNKLLSESEAQKKDERLPHNHVPTREDNFIPYQKVKVNVSGQDLSRPPVRYPFQYKPGAFYLVQHMKYVGGIKRYECLTCGKRFRDKTDMRRHIQTHTGDKPYKCNFCDKAYTSSSGIRTHLSLFHKFVFKDKCISHDKHRDSSSEISEEQAKNYTVQQGLNISKGGGCNDGEDIVDENIDFENVSVTDEVTVDEINDDISGGKSQDKYTCSTNQNRDLVPQAYECSVCMETFSTISDLDNHIEIHNEEIPLYASDDSVLSEDDVEKSNSNDENSGATNDSKFPVSRVESDHRKSKDISADGIVDNEGADSYECCLCMQSFSTCSELDFHIKNHIGEKPNNDAELEYDSDDLINIKILSKSSESSCYKCPECDYTSPFCCNLYRHIRTNHKDYVIPKKYTLETMPQQECAERYKCSQCDQTTCSYSSLGRHMRRKHKGCMIPERRMVKVILKKEGAGNQLKRYQCPQCDQTTSFYSGLCRHMQRKHKGNVIPRKHMILKVSLSNIPLERIGVDSKRYQCSQCDHTCSFYSDFCQHMQNKHIRNFSKGSENEPLSNDEPEITEEYSKQYQCPQCDFATSFFSSLKRHMQRNHRDCEIPTKLRLDKTLLNFDDQKDYPKRYKCPECDQTTNFYSSLYRHMKRKHKGCAISTKRMLHKKPLHKRTQIKERDDLLRYKCPECDVTTTFFNTLRNHMRLKHSGCKIPSRHMAEKVPMGNAKEDSCKSYECPLCDYISPELQNFYGHIKKVHGGSKSDVEGEKNRKDLDSTGQEKGSTLVKTNDDDSAVEHCLHNKKGSGIVINGASISVLKNTKVCERSTEKTDIVISVVDHGETVGDTV